MNRFLLEIGIVEAPSDIILPAVNQLSLLIKNTCENYNLNYSVIKTFSTPRRLVVLIDGLPNKQKDIIFELKGPSEDIAKDQESKWTKPALGFAKKNNIDIKDLKFKKFEGKKYLFFQQKKIGLPVPELLKIHIIEWISKINFPKNMRWGPYKLRFIRPIRWIVALWNKSTISIKLEMLESGRKTYGHRFMSPGSFIIKDAGDYKKQLKKLNVLVDFEERREAIISQIKLLEKKFGFVVELNDNLLSEVTNLVEWPIVILGEFEKQFLNLPDEVLITSMAINQRYFPVFDENKKQKFKRRKKLLPFFVAVCNGNKKNIDVVIKGNAKVLSARLSDARFFYREDQKKKIEYFCKRSKNVVFFHKRGSQLQRTQRITLFSKFIAEKLNLSLEQQKNIELISSLCKFDLETQMVQEFPKLQGYMGGVYASLKNENDIVCRGIREHYFPRHSNDYLPKDSETAIVALADRIDLLSTAFSLNLKPSGAADPFALRRAAQGVIQIILGLSLSLDFQDLILKSIIILKDQLSLEFDIFKLKQEMQNFLVKRQRRFFQEKGFRHDLIDAVLGINSEESPLNDRDIRNLIPIEQLKFAEMLSQYLEKKIFKRSVKSIVRAENICKKYPNKIAKKINGTDFSLMEEKNLYKILKPIINSDQKTYWTPSNYLKQLLKIEPVVTIFFENVLVMDDDPVKCGNRLKLCKILSDWSKRHLDLKAIVFP